jgi:hypothetical protein
MSDYKTSLEHMRNVLDSRQCDRTGTKTSKIVDSNEDDEKHKSFNLLENIDLLNIVTKYTPSKNALLSMTSKTEKDNLAEIIQEEETPSGGIVFALEVSSLSMDVG